MAVYEVTGPDGVKYRVTAPDGATEDQVMEMVRQEAARPAVDTTEGFGRSVVQGGFFGAGDEVVAGGVALRNELGQALEGGWLDGILGDTVDRPMGEVYDASLDNQRNLLDQFTEEQPALAIGGEILGAIPSAMIGGGASVLRAGTPLAARMAQAAGVGGLQGTIYGALAGEGGAVNRGQEALQTGGLGVVFGPLGPSAETLARTGVRSLTNMLRGSPARQAGTTDPAMEAALRAAQADDALDGVGADRIAAAGDDAMLVDAGGSLVQALDGAMQTGGPGLRLAQERIGQRLQNASDNLTSTLDDALGAPAGVYTTETALRKGTATARGDAYDAAYAQAIDYSSDAGAELLNVIENRVTAQDIEVANALMRRKYGRTSQQIMADIAEDGTVTFREVPDVVQLDYITRALNDIASTENGKGLIGGTTAIGDAASDLSRTIRGLVKELVPEYANALKTAATPIQQREALLLGRDALGTKYARDEFIAQLANMTDAQRTYVAQGIRSQIDEVLARVKRTAGSGSDTEIREALKGIKELSSRANREKITALLGQDASDAMFASIDQAATAFELSSAVATNSLTAARLASQGVMKDSVEGTVSAALRRGDVLGLPKKAWQAFAGGTADDFARQGGEANRSLVDLLTRSGPEGQAALQMLMNTGPTINRGRVPGVIAGALGQGAVAPGANRLSDMLLAR